MCVHIQKPFEPSPGWFGHRHDLRMTPGARHEDPREPPTSEAPELETRPSPAASMTRVPELAYAEFVVALKDALRDFHSPDLLARNPLLRGGISNLGALTRPLDLKVLLTETVSTLFSNPRDEKLRRVIELTYFQPAPKQEAVADRLSLSFGTYRRYLTTARDRLARWLWENWRGVRPGQDLPSTVDLAANAEGPKREAAPSPGPDEPPAPRLSLVILPFVNVSGAEKVDHVANGITETLTTDLSRSSGLFVISRSTACAYKDKAIDARQIGR